MFISYAWNTQDEPAVNYEEPVDAIEKYLIRHNFEFQMSDGDEVGTAPSAASAGVLIRDRKSVTGHGRLIDFMRRAAKSSKVIVVHSKRYWQSVNCMFELFTLLQELEKNTNKSIDTTVIPVEHHTSGIQDITTLEKYLKFWNDFRTQKGPLPTRMARAGWNHDATADHARSTIRIFGDFISDINELNLQWRDGEQKVLEHIRQRLSLPARPAAAAEEIHD